MSRHIEEPSQAVNELWEAIRDSNPNCGSQTDANRALEQGHICFATIEVGEDMPPDQLPQFLTPVSSSPRAVATIALAGLGVGESIVDSEPVKSAPLAAECESHVSQRQFM